MNSSPMPRREVLKRLGVSAVAATGAPALWPRIALAADRAQTRTTPRRAKKVLVAGGGIGGLCAAYELMKLGHDVTVLEASNRPGGHVRTMHDPLPDGLYADLGAEQCTEPGYELWRAYTRQFGLELVPYPRRQNQIWFIQGKAHTEEMLRDRSVLSGFGFSQREIDFLSQRDWHDLSLLFFGPYLDAFKDEYQPFGVGLDELDKLSVTELLQREHASDAAIRFIGGKSTSALYELWHAAILKRRSVPLFPRKLFRIRGGNQRITDAFAAKLGARVRPGCPITRIQQGDTGVTVHYQEFGEDRSSEAEYLVNAIPLAVLKRIPVEPPWPEAKAWVIDNLVYDMQTRIVFQARTPFWKKEGHSPHMAVGHSHLHLVWETAEEVAGDRAILIASANPGTTEKQALAAYRAHYPGKSVEIEHTLAHQWFMDRWAPVCEREGFRVGQTARFWPNLMQPHGRIHFAGAYADNLNWGMEAATRSANRVAKAIHEA